MSYGEELISMNTEQLELELSNVSVTDFIARLRSSFKEEDRIVQLLITPNNNEWQDKLLGLSRGGKTYVLGKDGWTPFIDNITDNEI